MVGMQIINCALIPAAAQNAINLDATYSSVDGDRQISYFVLDHLWIEHAPTDTGDGIVTTFPAGSNGIFDGTISNSLIVGSPGINLANAGDSIHITRNLVAGAGPGLTANLVAGAVGPEVLTNVFTSCAGGIVITNGTSPRLLYNQLEPLPGCAAETNGANIDIIGAARPVYGALIKGNSISTGNTLSTYAIRVDNAISTISDSNMLYANTAGLTESLFTSNASQTILGTNVYAGSFIPTLLQSSEADLVTSAMIAPNSVPPTCQLYQLTGAQMTAAATSQNIALFTHPSAKTKVTGVSLKTNTAFSGSGLSSLVMTVGDDCCGTTLYTSTNYNLLTAVANANFQDTAVFHGSGVPASHVIAAVTANQNLNASTITGEVDVDVCWVVVP
jgi:hypothetical protein